MTLLRKTGTLLFALAMMALAFVPALLIPLLCTIGAPADPVPPAPGALEFPMRRGRCRSMRCCPARRGRWWDAGGTLVGSAGGGALEGATGCFVEEDEAHHAQGRGGFAGPHGGDHDARALL